MVNEQSIEMQHTKYDTISISSDEDDDQNNVVIYSDEEPQILYLKTKQAPQTAHDSVAGRRHDTNLTTTTNGQQQLQHNHLSKRQKVTHVGMPPDIVNRIAITRSDVYDPSTSYTKDGIPLEIEFMAGRAAAGSPGEKQHWNAMTSGLSSQTSFVTPLYHVPTKFLSHNTKDRPSKIKKRKIETPPYYMDAKLDTLMYCGPGYKLFPVALGTLPDHQDICDAWDRQVASNVRSRQTVITEDGSDLVDLQPTTELGSDPESGDEESWMSIIENECLSRILEILPEVKHAFALQRIRSRVMEGVHHEDGYNEEYMQLIANEVVAAILEQESYPKQDKSQEDNQDDDGVGKLVPLIKGNVGDYTYVIDGVGLLASHFGYIPTHHIYQAIIDKGSLYDAHLFLEQQEAEYTLSVTKPYKRHRNPRVNLEKKYTPAKPRSHCDTRWKNLVNELQAAKQRIARENLRLAKLREDEAAELANLEQHKIAGEIVECQCCFDEGVALNRVVHCEGENMHWFCYSCVKSLAENQVGNMRHEMTCMDGSGCKAALSTAGIGRAVPPKIVEKLAFNQQQAEISAAGIEGLEQCGHCEFKGICDPIEEDPVFRCRNPDCSRVTCRYCHESAHTPKSCEEAKTDRRISARHRVEEARSEAMIRPCPKCKVKMIKELGCNKMTCTQCGCVSCFVCKQDISDKKEGGYQHFNRPHATCKLYEPANFDRHVHDADEAERQAIKKARTEDTGLDEKELQIDTGLPKSKRAPKRGAAEVQREAYHRIVNLGELRPRPQAAFPPPPAFEAPRVLPPTIAQELDRIRAMHLQGMVLPDRRAWHGADVMGIPLLQHRLGTLRPMSHAPALQPLHPYPMPTMNMHGERVPATTMDQGHVPLRAQNPAGPRAAPQSNLAGERYASALQTPITGPRFDHGPGQMPAAMLEANQHAIIDNVPQLVEFDQINNEDVLMMPFATPTALQPDGAAFWDGITAQNPPYNGEYNDLMEGFEGW